MINFLLVRHGHTDWTLEKRYQGHSDLPLNEKGEKAVASLGQMLKGMKVNYLYASPLKRASKSAKILSSYLRLRPRMEKNVKEMNFGKWEGQTAKELLASKDKAYGKWMKAQFLKPPGGETFESLCRRVQTFMNTCLKKHKNKNVMVVAHGGPIRAFLMVAMGWTRKDLFRFKIDPASITIVRVGPKKHSQLACLNATAPKLDSMREMIHA